MTSLVLFFGKPGVTPRQEGFSSKRIEEHKQEGKTRNLKLQI
jgi:hypothetical protein